MTKLRHTNLVLFILAAGILSAQDIQREVKRSDEKEVDIKVESSFGSVNIKKGGSENIVSVKYKRKKKDRLPKLDLDYSLKKNVGNLEIGMHPEGAVVTHSEDGEVNVSIKNFDLKTEEWYLEFVEGIPLAITAELGAGKSDFDFTGLTISELSISTGASSSKLRFDEPNKGEIKTLKIESGVSKFTAENLSNANFNKMDFEGGVGSYYLDFGGTLNKEVQVNVNVGLGAITLVIPQKIGVKIKYEDSWLSNLSLDRDDFVRKKKGIYESENYASAEGRMNVFIESGLGSVKIKRSYK